MRCAGVVLSPPEAKRELHVTAKSKTESVGTALRAPSTIISNTQKSLTKSEKNLQSIVIHG